MAQPIYLKRSASQGNAPTTGQLALGEMAINTYDGKVFIKKDDGAEAIVEVGPVYSVNTQTGSVTLDADDIDDTSTNHKFASSTQLSFLDSLDTDLGTISVPANTTISAFGATLIDDVDADAARSTLSAAATGAVGSSGITMNTGVLLGRGTASTGAIEEITLGTNLSLSGTTLNASGTGGGMIYTFSETAPGSPTEGDEWFESDTGILYKYIDDGNTSQWVELIGGSGTVGGSTDLTYTASTRVLASSTGTDATLPLFTSTEAGLVGASGGGTTNFLRADGTWASPSGGGATNLSIANRGADTLDIASDTGTDATVPAATQSLTGLLTATDKTKLDGIATGAEVNVPTNLSYTASTRVLASSTGTDATLTLADGTNPGLMSSSDFTKLGGIAAGAEVNVATDLTYTASTRVLASSTGTDATLPLFTSTEAGLVGASGGGTDNFLRADGTWAAPAGGVSDGDKGDITVSGSGATWTIDNDSVTYAKMQNVSAQYRVLGRITAAAGDTEELTANNLVTVLGQATSKTGTGNIVLATSPTLTTPNIGIPSAGTLTNCTGLPVSTGISGLGTGVATFLATPSSANLAAAVTGETGSGALVFATSPTLVTPILGTPTSGTLTNCTGLPISTGVSGLATGIATFLATPTTANLKSATTGADDVVISATSGRISYGTTAPSTPTTGDIWIDTN